MQDHTTRAPPSSRVRVGFFILCPLVVINLSLANDFFGPYISLYRYKELNSHAQYYLNLQKHQKKHEKQLKLLWQLIDYTPSYLKTEKKN